MALHTIRQFGDPVLRQRAREVTAVDATVRALVRELFETMYDAPGIGLAANQIGVLQRVIVWDCEGAQGTLINPRILSSEGALEDEEGCLSIPGLGFGVVRASRIQVTGLQTQGRDVTLDLEGLGARIVQHEVDHLDGVLFIDRLSPALQKEAKRQLRDLQGSNKEAVRSPAI